MHFYIHIPFCRQKCPYCKFALTPIFDDLKKKRYLEYLKKEIREYFSKLETSDPGKLPENNKERLVPRSQWQKQRTIYFWWGTPSILSHDEVRDILECFPFYREKCVEISFESNPEDLTRKYVSGLFELGITRLSVGVQSLNDETLKSIHRSDRKSIFQALSAIREAFTDFLGISVNVDFILGLPYVKPWETLENIEEIHATFPFISHTSTYILEDEKYPKDWKENSLTETEIQKEFLNILGYFEWKNWNHYELSNFSHPGYECKHNQSYWDHSPYRWFWLSASSYEGWKRWNNTPSFSGYFAGKIGDEETLTDEQIEIEKMMFWLRTDGYDIQKWGINREKLNQFIEERLITQTDKKIRLTKTWIFLIDHIMSGLLL